MPNLDPINAKCHRFEMSRIERVFADAHQSFDITFDSTGFAVTDLRSRAFKSVRMAWTKVLRERGRLRAI